MSLETRKVLDMVAEGKITADDAEKLLAKLANANPSTATETDPSTAKPKPRSLRIVVEKPGKKPVNIRMPLSFLRTGTAIVGLLPGQVSDELRERGIDLAMLNGKNGDELMSMLHELQLDVDKGDGKKVRIFCE